MTSQLLVVLGLVVGLIALAAFFWPQLQAFFKRLAPPPTLVVSPPERVYSTGEARVVMPVEGACSRSSCKQATGKPDDADQQAYAMLKSLQEYFTKIGSQEGVASINRAGQCLFALPRPAAPAQPAPAAPAAAATAQQAQAAVTQPPA